MGAYRDIYRVLYMSCMVLNGYYRNIKGVLNECYRDITVVLHGCYMSVTRVSQGYNRCVTWVIQVFYMDVPAPQS